MLFLVRSAERDVVDPTDTNPGRNAGRPNLDVQLRARSARSNLEDENLSRRIARDREIGHLAKTKNFGEHQRGWLEPPDRQLYFIHPAHAILHRNRRSRPWTSTAICRGVDQGQALAFQIDAAADGGR